MILNEEYIARPKRLLKFLSQEFLHSLMLSWETTWIQNISFSTRNHQKTIIELRKKASSPLFIKENDILSPIEGDSSAIFLGQFHVKIINLNDNHNFSVSIKVTSVNAITSIDDNLRENRVDFQPLFPRKTHILPVSFLHAPKLW